MKFKNPLDYVKNIINKFKELVNYPYKKKVYTGILIILLVFAIPFTPICFWFAYTSVPSKNNISAVTGIITELNCYPSGFKHGPYCMAKFDNHFFKYQFTDDISGSKSVLYKAYYDKQCVFIEFHHSLIYKVEDCNGNIIYSANNKILKNLHFERKVALYLGFFFLVLSILLTFLLNQEYKKEIKISNKGLNNE